MSHNSNVVIKFSGELGSKYKESPPNDDEGGVGGLNNTPYLMKPLVIMSLSLESYVTSMMNQKP